MAVWESFPACPVASDTAKRETEDLVTVAIRTVLGRYDTEELPDVSTQVVALILSDETFAPLRARIYSSLFDA